MRGASIFAYICVMWILIIAGGGLLITIIAPISISGYGAIDNLLDSTIKACIAILLVIVWIFLMLKIKDWIFQKHISH